MRRETGACGAPENAVPRSRVAGPIAPCSLLWWSVEQDGHAQEPSGTGLRKAEAVLETRVRRESRCGRAAGPSSVGCFPSRPAQPRAAEAAVPGSTGWRGPSAIAALSHPVGCFPATACSKINGTARPSTSKKSMNHCSPAPKSVCQVYKMWFRP